MRLSTARRQMSAPAKKIVLAREKGDPLLVNYTVHGRAAISSVS
jgi:hypothetical protein